MRRGCRIGPSHPRLGAAASQFALPLLDHYYSHQQIYRPTSAFAVERLRAIRAQLERGGTVYIGGIAVGGSHNSGVALLEVSPERGPQIICNNEEERFSGKKHTTEYPFNAIDALAKIMDRIGIGSDQIETWVGTFDYAALGASVIRTFFEEFPWSALNALSQTANPAFEVNFGFQAHGAANKLGRQLGVDHPVPIVGIPHHDNHAWFSFSTSPFARSETPVVIAVLDAMGDQGAISLYTARDGLIQKLRCNNSMYDSLGIYYMIISSTQGGWSWLSSEGRYMGAAAYGNLDRNANPFYGPLSEIFCLRPEGQVYLNRSLANWHRSLFRNPYTWKLIRILGDPITYKDMWNPDAILRVEDTQHSVSTQERYDKAAATQMVFEDAVFHIIDYLIRQTGSNKLILTGGTALNALANMHALEHFDEDYYRRALGRRERLHLWVPPIPGDSGAPIGAAYIFAHLAGAGTGLPLHHAFYCGLAPTATEIRAALGNAPDVMWTELGDIAAPARLRAIADFMAFMTARDGVFAIMQGAAETGPRALGHRSIFANPCNPRTRAVLNERVKYREAIRPLAPMMTLEAAHRWFDLSEGASDADYSAYNYMVLTARAKPEARVRIPAVIHADGTGRLQIVREDTNPLAYAYLKALGRRIGVEVAVNTSFNVGGPIVQTAIQAVDTLRRSRAMDAVLMFAEGGPVFAAWQNATDGPEERRRFRKWLAEWQSKQLMC
jgi:carbamoyltransferase